jgi:phosphoserine phosphatase
MADAAHQQPRIPGRGPGEDSSDYRKWRKQQEAAAAVNAAAAQASVPIPSAAAVAAAAPAIASAAAPIPSSLGPRPVSWLLAQLRSLDCVCFDVDSTVSAEEGIDVLAASLGAEKGAAVKAFTNAAMGGAVPFEVSLRERLNIMRPSKDDVAACVVQQPASFSPGFEEFLTFWRGWYARRHAGAELPVFLVSGGFRPLIEPLRVRLGLPESHVFANEFRFDAEGQYESFDETAPTSRSGGKARALQSILATPPSVHSVCMVGDGATDLEACPPAELMIGYGGIAQRAAVKERAHVFIEHWAELRTLLEQADQEDAEDGAAKQR